MLLPANPLHFRKGRATGKRAAPSPLPTTLSVVDVVDIVWEEPELTFEVIVNTTEDAPLVIAPLSEFKWTGHYNNFACDGIAAEIVAFNRIRVTIIAFNPDPAANSVGYLNDPSDIADSLGRTLGAFVWAI